MTDPFTASPAALTLLQQFEGGPHGGFAAHPYLCPAGFPTVGWGHRLTRIDRLTFPLSAEQAEALLHADLARFAEPLRRLIHVPLTQSMTDALLCFVFNVGPLALKNSSLLKCLNAGDTAKAADQFLRWDKARNPKTGKKEALRGLTRRRQAERALFLRDGLTPTPTPGA